MEIAKVCSTGFLLILNGIFAIIGFMLMVAGSAGFAYLEKFSCCINMSGLAGLVAMGLFVLIFSIMGVVGVLKKNKCILYIYVLAVTLCLISEIGAGSFVVAYSATFTAAAKESTDCSNSAITQACVFANAANHKMHSYIDCSFFECCAKDNFTATALYISDKWNTSVCTEHTFNLNKETCDVAKKISFRGKNLMNCQESMVDYRADFYEFFTDNMHWVGAFCVAFGVIQLLSMVGACFIIRSSDAKGELDDSL